MLRLIFRLGANSLLCLCALAFVENRPAVAQSQSLFGSQGPSSSSRTSSSMFGSSSKSGSSRQGTGANASVTGQGFLQTAKIGDLGALQNQGFVGRGNGTNGFVGRSTVGQTSNQNRSFGQQGFNSFGRGQGQGRGNRGNQNSTTNNNAGNNSSNTTSRTLIHPRHEVAFDYQHPTATAMSESLHERVRDLAARRPDLSGLEVDFNDASGEATLRGTVKSAGAAKVAQALLRLEPGVRSVRSELTIAANSPPAVPAPGTP